MYCDAPEAPTHQVGSHHCTPIGKLLRKTGFDEVPQIWNVLNGTMSIVGPRPCLPKQRELISARSRHGVFDVLPGITGLSQANEIDMSDEDKLIESDTYYVQNRSLTMDARIIFQTVMLVFKKLRR